MFVHVVLPGQEAGAGSLEDSFKFPSMQEVGEDLVSVLDHLNIPLVIGMGEGAGANILARLVLFRYLRTEQRDDSNFFYQGKYKYKSFIRFGMAHPTRFRVNSLKKITIFKI